jgi:hypothetical protein
MKDIVRKIGVVAAAVLLTGTSCRENGVTAERKHGKNDRSFGHEGGVTLLIKDADLMQVDSNPQYNTAEWHFKVNKPGRYDIWLSSLTCDTSHLLFAENVTITAGDARIEKKPVGDEIVIDDKSVKSPWYRADSHMGSVFFSEPGEYQVQVISDRVMALPSDPSALNIDKHTLINSLILKPMVN